MVQKKQDKEPADELKIFLKDVLSGKIKIEKVTNLPKHLILQKWTQKALDDKDKDQGRMLQMIVDRLFPLAQTLNINDASRKARDGLFNSKFIGVLPKDDAGTAENSNIEKILSEDDGPDATVVAN